MTETTTLTVFQQIVNRLGTRDPNMAILALLDRIEKLELAKVETPVEKAENQVEAGNENVEYKSVREKRIAALVKARAARKAKKEA